MEEEYMIKEMLKEIERMIRIIIREVKKKQVTTKKE
jgi:hypothetical protein